MNDWADIAERCDKLPILSEGHIGYKPMSEKQNLLKQVDIIARLAVQCVSTHFLSQKPNSFGGFQNPQIILTPIGFKPMSETQNRLKQVDIITLPTVQSVSTHFLSQPPNSFGSS